MTPFVPTPISLESAANVAFGHAKDDVAWAAQRYMAAWLDDPHATGLDEAMAAGWDGLRKALDRLTALGWVPGPERVGTALAGSGEALGWQPIETSPKDGTIVIIATAGAPYGPDMARWGKEWNGPAWLDAGGRPCPPPTHWQPRPDPPGSLTGAGDGG